MSGTDDLAAILEQQHQALAEFVKGDPEPLKGLYSRRADVALANPWGPAVRGWEAAAERMERAASMFRDGTVDGFEPIAQFAAADLACLVEIERYEVKVGGSDEPGSVALRVTSVFRREDGDWKLVHRHADPITAPQSPESLLEN
jgi:ketosteroid isomerase-like protein